MGVMEDRIGQHPILNGPDRKFHAQTSVLGQTAKDLLGVVFL